MHHVLDGPPEYGGKGCAFAHCLAHAGARAADLSSPLLRQQLAAYHGMGDVQLEVAQKPEISSDTPAAAGDLRYSVKLVRCSAALHQQRWQGSRHTGCRMSRQVR
jgi:hypothetical protein